MRFTLKRTDRMPGRAGAYKYGPATIWISGPIAGTWYATVRFRSQEKDLDARSLDGVLDKATRWIDEAPELSSSRDSRSRRAAPRPRRDPRKIGSRITSEGDSLIVKEALSETWIVGRNPRGHFVVAHRNPHTKRWDSLEWFASMDRASAALHRRAR